jgi:photosystem II stability/assembly factor-like uncharacterized protein
MPDTVLIDEGLNKQQEIIDIASTITGKQLTMINVQKKSIGSEDLTNISMANPEEGWVATKTLLYKTLDGWQTWKIIQTPQPKDAHIVSLYYSNEELGWLAFQNDDDKSNVHVWLYNTKDGGKTWQLQFEESEVLLNQMVFLDEKTGWLVGMKYTGIGPLRFIPCLYYTLDQGKRWRDVAGSLNNLIFKDENAGLIQTNNAIVGVSAENVMTATVLTSAKQIYRTSDNGATWEYIGRLQNEPTQTSINRFSKRAIDKLWLIGGADTVEGMWGVVAIEENTNKWVSYRLQGVNFSDGVFLSKHNLIACGAISVGASSGKRYGIILLSEDRGKTWAEIYRSPDVNLIERLEIIDNSHIMASGENGLLLQLKFKKSSE